MSHYIRLDSSNRIIKGFSDVFEAAESTDICILTDTAQVYRQFELNGITNPPLFDQNGAPLYKYIDSKIVSTASDDNTDYTKSAQIADIKVQLSALDVYLPRSVEDLIALQAIDTAALPQEMQNRITKKQELRAELQSLSAE